MFEFEGTIESSKSLFNRGLIIQSYGDDVSLVGESSCEDVALMKKALLGLKNGEKEFDCGEAGTVLRFLMARVSREHGVWILRGSRRLLSRPHKPLIDCLSKVGVDIEVFEDHMKITSHGWKKIDALAINCEKSSQFITSLVLNAWNLPFDLNIQMSEKKASEAYLVMTFILSQHFGLVLRMNGANALFIPKGQKPEEKGYSLEADLSSCFALSACAIFDGNVKINDFPEKSFQPDRLFVPLLQAMGAKLFYNHSQLNIQKTEKLKPVEVDLSNTPDLFPVLAILVSRANGDSLLEGLSVLAHKESDRLKNTLDLLRRLKRSYKLDGDHLTIYGNPAEFDASGDFQPDQDHRMAMAAQVANCGGANFNILNQQVVNKSFPNFWKIVN